MAADNNAQERPPGSGVSSEHARRERSVRWVYLWLLFSSIFTVPWMGWGLRQLDARFEQSMLPWTGSEPAWSPDGQSIAFISSRSGRETIHIMNADGTNPRQLLPVSPAYTTDYDPDWSPDGRQIAYSSDRTGNFEIYVANLDTGVARQLTHGLANDENPSWSPDGDLIAFWSNRTGNQDVFVMNADGSGVRNLTNHPANDYWPDWSPDGEWLAFTSDRGGNKDIYLMDRDGGGVRQLTDEADNESWPRWSPDGRWLAYTTYEHGHAEIELAAMENGTLGPLPPTWVDGHNAAWSPDGKLIAFAAPWDNGTQLCVMERDGTGIRSLSAVATDAARSSAHIPVREYVGAVAQPALLLLVLLIPLGSRLVYVRRHAQQAVALAVVRVCSTVLLVGMSRGSLLAVWVVINGGLWIFGSVWGLRQIRRGECWLMRRRGEVCGLPRPWPAERALPPAVELSGESLSLGEASTDEGRRAATVEALRTAFRTGTSQERQRAIESLQGLGEIEDF